MLPVTVDRALVDLGAGDDGIFIGQILIDDPTSLAQLVLLGPKFSLVKGGTGDDTFTGQDEVVGLAFLKDPTTTGFEIILNNN